MYKSLLFLALLIPGMAVATSVVDPTANELRSLDLEGAQRFSEQSSAIKAALAKGTLDRQEQAKVLGALDRISAILEAGGGVDGLNKEQKVRLFNEQEVVNTALTRAHDDDRMICRRETITGSNRPVNRCETVGNRRRAQEQTQSLIRK